MPQITIRDARRRLAAAPLGGLFAQHLGDLARHAEDFDDAPLAGLVGRTTLRLARALLATAAESPEAPEALEDTLVLRVQAFARARLGDPDLGPGTIASAHGISLRHLYAVFAGAGLQLEQWLIGERLEAARRELGQPGARRRTIAAVAHRWGFRSHAHFTHRFRDAYGMTPREWRTACEEQRLRGSRGP
ncbi:helix-turn-helix domain-containing protein [Nocardioides sp. GY 10113]|uniref:helix-turn-helix domain-containing protein n=1 Tax=Nocardioides sp. GY 10113 TaxID=2569761 RepID=UPI0010A8D7DB|nr:helix-turn-helix domain-containing protein [Nocardioides sp. GY 10113]TIC84877.1 helix-turn-helix domain-containing protein [Nocardioides sp. GY 10113]